MGNTITNLLKDAYSAIEIVSREDRGILSAVTRDVTAERTAKGTTVRNPVAPQNSDYSITPSMTPPAAADMTYTNRTISLDNLYGYKFSFTTEEEMGLKASDNNFQTLWQQNIAQGARTLSARMSASLTALYYNASRAYGTSGTTPFATDIKALSAAQNMLDKNGAPAGDRHFVLDHAAAYNLTSLTQLTNVNQAGDSAQLRQGVLRDLFGFQIRKDAAIALHTAGTSTGQDCTAVEPIGETTIAYDGGDGGTILVGDVILPASDTSGPGGTVSGYVVNTAVTAASGSIIVNAPGMLAATTIGQELPLSASYRANLAFSRNALVLAARAPIGGDSAVDEMFIPDPVTGLVFRLAKYAGHHIINYEMSILYGVGVGNPAHMVIVKG